MRTRGFTLIELLIVIAIILILIAIALPNFLEAQIRAKVTKAKAEERSMATAMDEYLLDFAMYPADHDNNEDDENGLFQLTSPIKYIASLPQDPFNQSGGGLDGVEPGFYEMGSTGIQPRIVAGLGGFVAKGGHLYKKRNNIHAFVIMSAGPDGGENFHGNDDWPFPEGNGMTNPCPLVMGGYNYAPTNGTKSNGEIMHFGGAWRSGSYCIDGWQWIRGPGFETY